MHLGEGQEIDRYTVVEHIGRGGMAEVYRVRHNTLGTDHALKVLSLNVPSIRERLIQEGRVQAQLQHPNIVAVTDVLDVQGSPGLLMQLVKGPSLEDWLRCNQPSIDEALRIFAGILEALEEAHRLDIVHRDLKPGNVMMSTQRGVLTPKVTDFGLAKLLADEASPTRTRTGLPMGTPAYMSPEQITDAKSVDRRADIFAMGCILYELCCGQMAFIGANTLEVFNAVAGGDYAPPRDLAPDLPEPVVRAIEGCLQNQRELRIGSCEELAAVLEGGGVNPSDAPTLAPTGPLGSPTPAPSTPPITSRPASPTCAPFARGRARPPDSSIPDESRPGLLWLLGAGAAVVLLGLGAAVVGGGLLTWWATRTQQLPPEPVQIEAPPDPTVAEVPAEAPTELQPDPVAPTPLPAPDDPVVEPIVPDDQPEVPEPAVPDTGLVVIEGDAIAIALIDARGTRLGPGRLPPGTYDLEASFHGGATIRQPGKVTVRAGRTTTLRCVALLETCN